MSPTSTMPDPGGAPGASMPAPPAFAGAGTVPTSTSSAGERSSYARTLALNAFNRTSLSPAAALAWIRSAGAPEAWRTVQLVADPPLRADLWAYLGDEDLWAAFQGDTAPLADFDEDTLALPATDVLLLAQYEPRAPDTDDDPGEMHRVAVFYDERTARWEAWQWSVPRGAAGAAVLDGVLKQGANGRWYADSEGEPDGYLVESASGRVCADPAALAADYHLRVTEQARVRVYEV